MNRAMRWLSSAIIVLLVGLIVMGVFEICPPQGPWPAPPWCPDSPFAWPFQAGDDGLDAAAPSSPEPQVEESREGALVSMSEQLLAGLERVQVYFDQGLVGLGGFQPGGVTFSAGRAARVVYRQFAGAYDIPEGFTGPLAEDGYIAAPEGACGAGALPRVRFSDQAGEPVTGERLADEAVETIDFAALIGEAEDGSSLESMISAALQPGDLRLTTPQGWNEALWEPLAATQQPMDSLIDYQLWNTAEAIESMVADSIEARMLAMGIPDLVIEAFRQSELHGWFASRPAEPEYALASMDVIAEFQGGFSGTITEQRSFSLPGPGEMPEFGPLSGGGEIVFEHPILGELRFEVELEWTEWDALGRVHVGEMRMLEPEAGYEIHLRFEQDGSKQGELYVDGEQVGRVELIVKGNETTLEFFPLE